MERNLNIAMDVSDVHGVYEGGRAIEDGKEPEGSAAERLPRARPDSTGVPLACLAPMSQLSQLTGQRSQLMGQQGREGFL